MKPVFADTSFYIALVRPDDVLHDRCLEFDREYAGSFMTSEFVLIELGNWLADIHLRPIFTQLNRLLQSNPRTTIVPATADWVAQGLALYAGRPDKRWSFTDCISFEMMYHHDLTDVLTGDRHFAQAGFNAILAQP